MSIKGYLYVYLLGGLTFIPGLLIIGIYYIWTYGSSPIGDSDPLKRLQKILSTQELASSDPPVDLNTDLRPGDGEKPTPSTTHNDATRPRSSSSASTTAAAGGKKPSHPPPKLTEKHLTGWLTIRRSFHPQKTGLINGAMAAAGASGAASGNASGAGKETVIGGFKQGLTEIRHDRKGEKEGEDNASTGSGTGTGKYSSMLLNGYRSIVDRTAGTGASTGSNGSGGGANGGKQTVLGPQYPTSSTVNGNNNQPAIKEFVFCALKGSVLFMYNDASMDDCIGVIGMEGYSVSISRGDSSDEEDGMTDDSDALSEGEKERLRDSGLPEDEKGRIRGNARRKRRRGGEEPIKDGELFAKRNAIVLRAVPMKPKSKRTKSTASVGGVGGSPTMKRSASTRTAEANAINPPEASSSTRRGSLPAGSAAGPQASMSVETPPSLQRKSTAPAEGADSITAGSHGNVATGNGPPLMALTKGMNLGTAGMPLPGEAGREITPTMPEADERTREKRRREKRKRESKRLDVEARPWYIFPKNNVKAETWYLALLAKSHTDPPSPTSSRHAAREGGRGHVHVPRPTFDRIFPHNDMQRLIDTLNEDSDQIPVRWLNAMLGRIFLGICKTAALEALIIEKFMKKIRKVKTPSFLGEIIVKEVDVGTTPPYFSKPMLKELTADGECAFEVALHYNGEVRITIGTTAIIPTGFGFKPYEINLELMVVVQSLHGNVAVRIKRPPSNRIWWGFTAMPKLEMRILPIVSDRKIQVGMILKAIEKQIRDAVQESVVLPNMDDLAFFDTRHLRTRGGLFNEAGKQAGIPISADIGPDGLEPIPTSQGMSKGSSTGTGLHKKASSVTTVQPSMSVDALDLPESTARDLARKSSGDKADTASIASTTSLSQSITDSTRKWFAQKTSNMDARLGSEVSGRASPAEKSSTAAEPESLTATVKPRIEKTQIGFEPMKSGTSTPTRATGTSVEAVTSSTTNHNVLDRPQDDNVKLDALPKTVPPPAEVRLPSPARGSEIPRSATPPAPAVHRLSTPSVHGLPIDASRDAQYHASAATAATLMNSIRARTADKKALQSSVNEAKDAMRTWGKTWAARRGLTQDPILAESDEQIAKKLQAVENQMAQTRRAEPSPSAAQRVATSIPVVAAPKPIEISHRKGNSLQERLALAASHSTGSPGSTSSSLPKSPPDNASTLSATSPGSNQDSTSPNSATRGISPTANLVRQQPSGVAAMAVPRVPKRPDAVTAISSATSEAASAVGPAAPGPRLPVRPRALSYNKAEATTAASPTSTDFSTALSSSPARPSALSKAPAGPPEIADDQTSGDQDEAKEEGASSATVPAPAVSGKSSPKEPASIPSPKSERASSTPPPLVTPSKSTPSSPLAEIPAAATTTSPQPSSKPPSLPPRSRPASIRRRSSIPTETLNGTQVNGSGDVGDVSVDVEGEGEVAVGAAPALPKRPETPAANGGRSAADALMDALEVDRKVREGGGEI